MLDSIISKILLGISLAAPIGPVTTEMIKRGLTSGFWGAFSVRIGGAIANLLLLILAYFGLGIITQYHKIMFIIAMLGVIALIYLGVKNILKAFNHTSSNILDNCNQKKHKYSIKNGIIVGFSLSCANPIGLMFWLGTFAASMQQLSTTKFNLNDLLINLFIIAGVLIWGMFISIILHFFRKYINARKLKIITAVSGLILIYFGIKYGIISYKNLNKILP